MMESSARCGSGGIRGWLHWNMNADSRQMVWAITGTAGTAVVPAFAVPHLDNRILITHDGRTAEQTLGDQTSYTYQLAALADTLQTGAEFLIDVDDSVANAELIDKVYRRAGLSPRGSYDAFAISRWLARRPRPLERSLSLSGESERQIVGAAHKEGRWIP
jgi:hypothetical protein